MSALTGGLPDDIRRALQNAADFFFKSNLRIGVPEDATASENLHCFFFSATTPSTANTEFSVAHHLQSVPYLLIPVLNVQNVNEAIVPLTVTRAADAQRVYLKSSSTSAPVRFMLESP